MNLGATAGLHTVPELSCAYCGRREALPGDAAARHRHLQLRLKQLERARLMVEAPLQSYRTVKLAMLPGLVVLTLVSVAQVNTLLATARVAATPPTVLLPVALTLGALVGSVAMTSSFRRLVRPALRARPPEAEGLALRCRSCGGPLPNVKQSSVRCGYCSAENLLDAALTRNVGALLAQEADSFRKRALGERPDPNRYNAPLRAFYSWGGAAAGVSFVLLLAAAALL